MNQCFSRVGRLAGHWCCGLGLIPYKDGNTSPDALPPSGVVKKHLECDIDSASDAAIALDSVGLKPVSFFEVLPAREDWVKVVGCTCAQIPFSGTERNLSVVCTACRLAAKEIVEGNQSLRKKQCKDNQPLRKRQCTSR